MDTEFFKSVSKQTWFYYTIICVLVVYSMTTLVDIKIGHLFAFIVCVLFLFFNTKQMNDQIDSTNIELEYKYNDLGNTSFTPDYLYTDADLVSLFHTIKIDLYDYNSTAYINALKACDNLLRIRNDFETKLCVPVIPNLSKNFEPGKLHKKVEYDLQLECTDDNMLINAYPNYQIAKEQLKRCMNELQSIIITITEPVLHYKHTTSLKRLHILLKRNLDIIYHIYNKKKKIHDTHITDYDSYVPYNEHTGLTGVNDQKHTDNFNFY